MTIEKITISGNKDFKKEFGNTFDIEVKSSFETTRQELDNLKREVENLDENIAREKIISFLNQKAQRLQISKDELYSLRVDYSQNQIQDDILDEETQNGEIEIFPDTPLGNFVKDINSGGSGIISGAIGYVFGKYKNANGIDQIAGALADDDGGEGIFSRIKTAFGAIMWSIAPGFAKLLKLENPKEKLKDEARKLQEEKKQKAEDEARKAQEEARKLQEKIEQRTKIGYNQYIGIYFKLFRSTNEIDDIRIERRKEQDISKLLFEQDIFQKMKLQDLNKKTTIDTLYKSILPNISTQINLKDLKEDEIKLYIKVILKSFYGGYHESKKPFYRKDQPELINRGNIFLLSVFKKQNKDINILTMGEIFDTLNEVKDFGSILGDESSISLEGIENAIKGSSQNIISRGMSSISDLSEKDFESIKSGLSIRMQNISHFKNITTSILKLSNSRVLGNNFQAGGEVNDKFLENDELQAFIGDENEGLLKFGNEIYENFFKSGDLIKSSSQISKDHITIQSIYQIYLITGGKTNLEELSPMQKVHLTTNILASYGGPMELGGTISDIIDKITTNKLEVDSDVKNILFSVGKYLINASIDAAKFVGNVWWGMSTEHKIYSLGFIFILGKLPIYKKRGSLW